uniref:Uncharacterized protein n=1 Tax=Sinorhizobium fredii (strain NBRC 101917 / NGR234) TaxID=394 RepID=Q6W0Y5_SINFN|nr:Hypothetical protein RNGR00458 [Sinorhizobium fredii NGR234]
MIIDDSAGGMPVKFLQNFGILGRFSCIPRQFAVVWMRRTQAGASARAAGHRKKLLDNQLLSPQSYASVLALAKMQLR